MNVKKASEDWCCPPRTVSSYCKKGYIDGCRMIDGSYDIPDDARQPMVSQAKLQTSIYKNILKATNNVMAINALAR